MKKPKRSAALQGHVTPDEYRQVRALSEQTGLTVSDFVRRVCLGYRVESRVEQQAIMELSKVAGELKRQGGLVKLALAAGHSREQVHRLLHEMDEILDEVKQKIRLI